VAVGAVPVQDRRGHEGAREAERTHPRREDAADARGHEHCGEQADARGREQRQHRREREPVDRRLIDHRTSWARPGKPGGTPKVRSVIAAGQADRTSRQATSGTRIPSSAGRRSSALSETDGPGLWWSTAEISRSVYIAASTIATAPTTDQPQPTGKTPVRIMNSPANAVEPGTASAITPVAISIVASAGRPFAIPPSRRSSPVAARRSTEPASMKSVAEI